MHRKLITVIPRISHLRDKTPETLPGEWDGISELGDVFLSELLPQQPLPIHSIDYRSVHLVKLVPYSHLSEPTKTTKSPDRAHGPIFDRGSLARKKQLAELRHRACH